MRGAETVGTSAASAAPGSWPLRRADRAGLRRCAAERRACDERFFLRGLAARRRGLAERRRGLAERRRRFGLGLLLASSVALLGLWS